MPISFAPYKPGSELAPTRVPQRIPALNEAAARIGRNGEAQEQVVSLKGSCFCGRVRYSVTAPLRAARSCHCSRCRRAFSGAGSTYAEIAPGSFNWESGEDNLTHYDTAPGWGLCFCRTCGTTLCGTHDGLVHG